MTHERSPLSVAEAVMRVVGTIGMSEARRLTRRSDRQIRKWTQPNDPATPTIAQAIALDAAYQVAGGEGAPVVEAAAAQVGIQVCQQRATEAQLAEDAGTLARESGEAVSATLIALQPGASPRQRHRAFVEAEQAYRSAGALVRRLAKFQPFGMVPGAGKTGGFPNV